MATKFVRYPKHVSNLFKTLTDQNIPQNTKLTTQNKILNEFNCTHNPKNVNFNVNKCKFSVTCTVNGTAGHAETTSTTQGLSKLQAQELILRLNGEERNILMTALNEYQSKLVKEEYEGKMNRY